MPVTEDDLRALAEEADATDGGDKVRFAISTEHIANPNKKIRVALASPDGGLEDLGTLSGMDGLVTYWMAGQMLAAADPRLGDPFKIVRAALIKTGHLEFDVDIALNIKAAVLSKP